MQIDIMFTGFGGQGILMMGKILALTALHKEKEVAWVPSYGPEMRGGTAYCNVVISDNTIGSPIIQNPMHLVAMNRPSLEKFAPNVKPGGVIITNNSLIPIDSGRTDIKEYKVPATDIANELGNVKVSNMVALGGFVAATKIFSFEDVVKVMENELAKKPEFLSINLAAMEKGKNIVEG